MKSMINTTTDGCYNSVPKLASFISNQIHCSPTTVVAIYARYSSDQQRETSIDDQIRRCREVAEKHGWSVDPEFIFSDAALSGTEKHLHKREGYKKLIELWESGKVNVIIIDEFSRFTRDAVEQALIMRRFENNQRVRMITADGIDTSQANWQLQVGLMGIVGQQTIRDTQHRVERGMVGALERGYMIAPPAFGYKFKRHFDSLGNRVGTDWEIVEE
ncbi:MAG: recombinase family protein, partial [Herbaspirillum sp.]